MSQKLGRNDPCWCGSGKKLKKCHGGKPVARQAAVAVRPRGDRTPITTHHVFDGKRWIERPGLLAATVGIQPLGSIDSELIGLRRSWGQQLEADDVNGLAASLNDIEHKLRGVRYHRDNFERAETAVIERLRTSHVPPRGVSVEVRASDLLFEIEGFLYQVKSTLDMLVRVLTASGLRSMGQSFGDHGDRVLRQLDSVPESCSAYAGELRSMIESAQPAWIDQAVSFRDDIAHRGMLNEFRCFVQEPVVEADSVGVRFPEMPGGERATAYIARVEGELRRFVDAVVQIAIRIAVTLRTTNQNSRTTG